MQILAGNLAGELAPSSRILSGPPAVLGGGGGRGENLLAGSIYLIGFLSPSQSFCAVFINKEGKELWTFMC